MDRPDKDGDIDKLNEYIDWLEKVKVGLVQIIDRYHKKLVEVNSDKSEQEPTESRARTHG